MIKQFNKVTVKQSREAINKALASLKESHGISVSLGSISYTESSFTGKITVAPLSVDGEAKSQYEINWEAGNHFKFGLNAEDLGKTVVVYGEEFTIVGCKSRRGKRGVIGKSKSGALYNLDNHQVHLYLWNQ